MIKVRDEVKVDMVKYNKLPDSGFGHHANLLKKLIKRSAGIPTVYEIKGKEAGLASNAADRMVGLVWVPIEILTKVNESVDESLKVYNGQKWTQKDMENWWNTHDVSEKEQLLRNMAMNKRIATQPWNRLDTFVRNMLVMNSEGMKLKESINPLHAILEGRDIEETLLEGQGWEGEEAYDKVRDLIGMLFSFRKADVEDELDRIFKMIGKTNKDLNPENIPTYGKVQEELARCMTSMAQVKRYLEKAESLLLKTK